MAIANEIETLKTNITNAYTSISTKGGTIPTNKNTENLSSAIESIPSGGGSILGSKTITQNGTYKAINDNLDGYNTVDVNVSVESPYKWQRPTNWYDLPTILANCEDVVKNGVTYYPRMALQFIITNSNTIICNPSNLCYTANINNKYLIQTSDGQEIESNSGTITITFDTTKDSNTRYIIIYTDTLQYTYISSLDRNLPVVEIILGNGVWTTPHIGSSNSNNNNMWLRNFETLSTTEWTNFGYQYCFSSVNSLEHLYLPTITTMTNTTNSAISSFSLKDVDMPNLKTISMSYFGGSNNSLKRLNFPNLETTKASFGNNYGLMEINISKLKTIDNSYFLSSCPSYEILDLSSVVTGKPVFTNKYNLKKLILPDNFKITGWDISLCLMLPKDNLLEILNKLADVTGETTAYAITFGSNNLLKLSDEEVAIGTEKGWTIQ